MEDELDFEDLTLEYEDPNFFDIWNNCVVQSIQDISPKVVDLLVYNILFNIMTQSKLIPTTTFHVISFGLGIILLYSTIFIYNILHFLTFICCTYFVLYVICWVDFKKQRGIKRVTEVSCIFYILLCEFLYSNSENWMQSRGLFMIATMKIISLCIDLQEGIGLPSIFGYFGYMCSPSNSLFGPWISYNEYISVLFAKKEKDFQWLLRIIITVFIALCFLTISNCWGSYFIGDNSYKWVLAYRQALSFRTSHYFISYLSEAAMIAAGYCDSKHSQRSWGYQITYPLDIEFPSSLVRVVVTWNIPMHKFLKKYIYCPFLQFGRFKAILATFFVSALLHGFNLEIAAVLLTIGIYSYVQLKFQDKLSSMFNACLRVHPCKSCTHTYRKSHILVKLAHIMFCFLTIFNLIYLGVLMDSIGSHSCPSIYSKWENLDFMSHWVMSGIHIFTIL